MKRPRSGLAVAALLATLGLPGSPAPAAPLAPGAIAPDFTLPTASGGKLVSLKELLGRSRAVAILFIATRCPVSNAYNERMALLSAVYASKGIAFVGINSNKTEPAAEVAAHAKANGFGFPVLKDEGNRVADAYGATRTPEVFLLDPSGTVVYHGRIDENQDDAKNVMSPDFRNALDAVLAGKPVPVAETKAFGCTIKRV
ncbi:MAG: thioredoxin family protein [Acidithiobacillales bacterium]